MSASEYSTLGGTSALQGLIASDMERFYMGHGGPLDAREVERHACTLMRMNSKA